MGSNVNLTYQQGNKEQIKNNAKEYYEKNKEWLSIKAREKYETLSEDQIKTCTIVELMNKQKETQI